MISHHLIMQDILTISFRFSICMMRQNVFSVILIQDTLILNLLWKRRFTFWISLLIIITTFWNVYLKSTYSDILVNFNSFTFLLYKISLIKCLVDHAYKKHNAWASFHVNIAKIKKNVTLFFNIFDRQNYKILFGKNAS